MVAASALATISTNIPTARGQADADPRRQVRLRMSRARTQPARVRPLLEAAKDDPASRVGRGYPVVSTKPGEARGLPRSSVPTNRALMTAPTMPLSAKRPASLVGRSAAFGPDDRQRMYTSCSTGGLCMPDRTLPLASPTGRAAQPISDLTIGWHSCEANRAARQAIRFETAIARCGPARTAATRPLSTKMTVAQPPARSGLRLATYLREGGVDVRVGSPPHCLYGIAALARKRRCRFCATSCSCARSRLCDVLPKAVTTIPRLLRDHTHGTRNHRLERAVDFTPGADY